MQDMTTMMTLLILLGLGFGAGYGVREMISRRRRRKYARVAWR
jgi:hypothetical protein